MKVAIYTAIFGDKDELKEPFNFSKSNHIDYFLITDNDDIKSINYKVIFKKSTYDDITKNARYYKVKGLEMFKSYDYVIWHDANIQIIHSKIYSLIRLIDNKEIALIKHPERDCIYDEAIKCIELEKDYPFKIFKQIFFYFIHGINRNSGLYATGLFIINKNIISNAFLNIWWNEIRNKSRRDQLSLPYALSVGQIEPHILNEDIRNNEYSIFHSHKHKTYNYISSNNPKPFSSFSKYLAIKMICLLKKRTTKL